MAEKKYRFNVIDALIILVILIAGALLAYIFVFSDDTQSTGDNVRVEYVVEVTSLSADSFRGKINEGDEIFFNGTKKIKVGTVSKTPQEHYPSYKTAFSNSEGKEVYTPDEERFDITITFEADAVKDKKGYCIGEKLYLPVNGWADLIIGGVSCSVCCLELNVLD